MLHDCREGTANVHSRIKVSVESGFLAGTDGGLVFSTMMEMLDLSQRRMDQTHGE